MLWRLAELSTLTCEGEREDVIIQLDTLTSIIKNEICHTDDWGVPGIKFDTMCNQVAKRVLKYIDKKQEDGKSTCNSESAVERLVTNLRDYLREQTTVNRKDINNNYGKGDGTSYYYFLGKDTSFELLSLWLKRQDL